MKRVLGIGTALLDIIDHVDDKVINDIGLTKGTMKLIEREEIHTIRKHMTNPLVTSGGSVCNTIYEIVHSGYPGYFFGKISYDEYGDDFYQNLQTVGIGFKGPKQDYELPTGSCHVLVTPDGERTMLTYVGIGSRLEINDIKEDTFDNIDHVYLETYLWYHHLSREMFYKIGELSIEKGFELSIYKNRCNSFYD